MTAQSVSDCQAIAVRLAPAICFRITRRCNARCGFCLAPADGTHPDHGRLRQRLAWLLRQGVNNLMFCGGEPTLHPALPDLLRQARAGGAKTRLTTNAIAFDDDLLRVLDATATRVKVSLHGDRADHDRLVGEQAFCHTTANLRRLLDAGIATSVQTTLSADNADCVPWLIDYCLEQGVRRLSFLPFVARGHGRRQVRRFALTSAQRRALRNDVTARRRALNGRLDIRWLDFSTRPIQVVDADGRVVLEGAAQSMDRLLHQLP